MTTKTENRIGKTGERCTACQSRLVRQPVLCLLADVVNGVTGEVVGQSVTARLCATCAARRTAPVATPSVARQIRHSYREYGFCAACGDEGCYAERGGEIYGSEIYGGEL